MLNCTRPSLEFRSLSWWQLRVKEHDHLRPFLDVCVLTVLHTPPNTDWTHCFFSVSFVTLSTFLSLLDLILCSTCLSAPTTITSLHLPHTVPPHLAGPSFPSPLHVSSSLLPPFLFLLWSASISSSLQRGKAVSPSPLQWPIKSFWAPISLLIGWAGLSRYWEEGLALLGSCLSAYLSVCVYDLLCLCSRADLKFVTNMKYSHTWDQFFPTLGLHSICFPAVIRQHLLFLTINIYVMGIICRGRGGCLASL